MVTAFIFFLIILSIVAIESIIYLILYIFDLGNDIFNRIALSVIGGTFLLGLIKVLISLLKYRGP